MTTESKQTSPLYVPRFTPADYGSFFLAGQFSSLKLPVNVLRPAYLGALCATCAYALFACDICSHFS